MRPNWVKEGDARLSWEKTLALGRGAVVGAKCTDRIPGTNLRPAVGMQSRWACVLLGRSASYGQWTADPGAQRHPAG